MVPEGVGAEALFADEIGFGFDARDFREPVSGMLATRRTRYSIMRPAWIRSGRSGVMTWKASDSGVIRLRFFGLENKSHAVFAVAAMIWRL